MSGYTLFSIALEMRSGERLAEERDLYLGKNYI